jgi:hypothetical protein
MFPQIFSPSSQDKMKHKTPPTPELPFRDPASAEGNQLPGRVKGNFIHNRSRIRAEGSNRREWTSRVMRSTGAVSISERFATGTSTF